MGDALHVLYRFFDSEGELLYVGITNDPGYRFQQHQGTKFWFGQVARSTMEHFTSREELAAAEVRAIQTELPKFNGVYMPRDCLAPGIRPAGRPEIGEPINVRLGADLLALVDDYAAHNGYTRAQAIRFLLGAALSERHGNEPSGLTR